jgi:hypothetical protein
MYGNGWTDGVDTVANPLPFDVEGEINSRDEVSGIVISKNHELFGFSFTASLRYDQHENVHNCSLWKGDANAIRGYCSIDR